VAPMLWCYQGLETLEVPSIRAILGQSMKKKEGLCKAVRGVLDMRTSPSSFIPFEGKTNSMFASLRNNFAYTLLESHVVEVARGTEVQVRLHDFPLLASCFLGKAGASEPVVQPQGDQDASPVCR
jgi:molybdopterin biosynthesis enzyme